MHNKDLGSVIQEIRVWYCVQKELSICGCFRQRHSGITGKGHNGEH